MGAPIVHFEIGGRDSAKLASFYTSLLGWTAENYGPSMQMVNTGSKEGIQGHLSALGHEPHNYCVVYALVDDIESVLKKAATLGGSTCVPKTEVPQMGWFAWLKDPQGNMFGLWTAMKQG